MPVIHGVGEGLGVDPAIFLLELCLTFCLDGECLQTGGILNVAL